MISENKRSQFFFYFIFIGFFFLMLLEACFLSKEYRLKKEEANYFHLITPPGCMKIGSNLFCDQTETRNLDWQEYRYWIGRVFGTNSEEFLATMPDTSCWVEIYPCLNSLKERVIHKRDTTFYFISFPEHYLRHPMFRNYPVVGITQEQAMEYAKWRSDRVFEFILIRYGKLKMNPDQNAGNCFTIEKYLSGNYNGIRPDSSFNYYPEYRLPTIQEWKQVANYSDSVHQSFYKKHSNRSCLNCKLEWVDFQSDINPCSNDTLLSYPALKVNAFTGPFYCIRGNVSEWTNEKDVCIGGGWADRKERILMTDTFHLKTRNAWTGCRNVCEWKEWKK